MTDEERKTLSAIGKREVVETEAPERKKILSAAVQAVCGDRDMQYGKPEESFEAIADFWNAYLKDKIGVTARDVAMMMVLFKVARETYKPKLDNLVDIAGYAACAAECEV